MKFTIDSCTPNDLSNAVEWLKENVCADEVEYFNTFCSSKYWLAGLFKDQRLYIDVDGRKLRGSKRVEFMLKYS